MKAAIAVTPFRYLLQMPQEDAVSFILPSDIFTLARGEAIYYVSHAATERDER